MKHEQERDTIFNLFNLIRRGGKKKSKHTQDNYQDKKKKEIWIKLFDQTAIASHCKYYCSSLWDKTNWLQPISAQQVQLAVWSWGN